ncbi:MAG: CoA-binding protein [Syntrophales bacterium]|nr:CoA-binding protein [Syntrophales bacterium]
MDFFFRPKGIAVIGATRDQTKSGNFIVKNLKIGYDGPIYPVNPRYDSIDDLPCYPDIASIPDPVDLAIIFIPAHAVPKAVAECADRGIKGVMIQSSGFAEAGPEGEQLQAELKDMVKKRGIRIWGPNCMGLVDAVNRYVFSFIVAKAFEKRLLPGNVSLIVQSGMLSAGFLVDIMSHGVMGISKVCSIGNKLDIDECDILPHLIEDPNTHAIGCYLESIVRGRLFIDLCRQSPKPIVVLKGGRTGKGAQAAWSHTASLAGNHEIVRGALVQAGAIEVKDFKELMDICRSLASTPSVNIKNRPRIAILTFSGGAGIVFADFIEEYGMTVAELSEMTKERIGRLFPAWMPVGNPVDLFPALEKNRAAGLIVVQEALSAVLDDPSVDGIMIHLFAASFRGPIPFAELASMVKKAGKPVCIWLLGEREEVFKIQNEGRTHGIPTFVEIGRAVECMAAIFRNARLRSSSHA